MRRSLRVPTIPIHLRPPLERTDAEEPGAVAVESIGTIEDGLEDHTTTNVIAPEIVRESGNAMCFAREAALRASLGETGTWLEMIATVRQTAAIRATHLAGTIGDTTGETTTGGRIEMTANRTGICHPGNPGWPIGDTLPPLSRPRARPRRMLTQLVRRKDLDVSVQFRRRHLVMLLHLPEDLRLPTCLPLAMHRESLRSRFTLPGEQNQREQV